MARERLRLTRATNSCNSQIPEGFVKKNFFREYVI